MLPSSTSGVQAFAVAAETVLRNISQLRPDLDLALINQWANAQALASLEHDSLHYLDVAYRAVVRGELLPWQVSAERCPD